MIAQPSLDFFFLNQKILFKGHNLCSCVGRFKGKRIRIYFLKYRPQLNWYQIYYTFVIIVWTANIANLGRPTIIAKKFVFKYFDRIVRNFAGKKGRWTSSKMFCLSVFYANIVPQISTKHVSCKLLSCIVSITAFSLSYLLIKNIDKLHKNYPILFPFFFFQICIKVRSELMRIWHSGKFRESTCTQRPCSKVAKHRRELIYSQFEKKPTKLTFVRPACQNKLTKSTDLHPAGVKKERGSLSIIQWLHITSNLSPSSASKKSRYVTFPYVVFPKSGQLDFSKLESTANHPTWC